MNSERFLVALGEAIRARRKKLGFSQESFALEVGLDRTYVSGVERGVRNLSLKTLVMIAAGLQCLPSQILREAEKLLAERR